MPNISPVAGWSLDYIFALDLNRPGTAGEFLRASPERRQVIAALLSMTPLPSEPGQAKELAKFTSGGGHREILTAAFGSVPSGLRGALARSGPQPQPRSFYRTLHHLLSEPSKANVGRAIQQLDSLDLMRLRIAQTLPADICTANLIKLVGSMRTASDVAKLIDLMAKGGIDRVALAQALGRVATDTQLSEFWDRWTQKLTFPQHPVPRTANYTPVTEGAALRQLALRYRNCARRYLAQVLDGNDAFAEFAVGGNRAVIHLHKHGEVWRLEGMFAKDNGRIEPTLRAAAVSFLTDQGVQTAQIVPEKGGEWAVLRRLSGVHMFGF